MDCEHEIEPDPIAAERRWQQQLADVDAEIREEQSAEYQEERAAERAARERWRNLPPTRAPLGTRTHRMTDEQIFYADKDGN